MINHKIRVNLGFHANHQTQYSFPFPLFLSHSKSQHNERECIENKFGHLVFYFLKKGKKQGGIPQCKSPTIKQLPYFGIFQINT